MKQCPWCAQQINEAAIKCPYCQSLLQPQAEQATGKVTLIVDEGLIYFAKFAGFVLALIIAVGAAFFGYKANEAREQAFDAMSAARTAQHEAQKAQNESRRAQEDIQKDSQKFLDSFKASLQTRKTEIDQDIAGLRTAVVQIIGRNPSENSESADSFVNLARSAQGVQKNVDALEKRIAVLERGGGQSIAIASVLSVEEREKLRKQLQIKQTSSPASVLEGSRPSYDLVFTVCASKDEPCGDRGLESVEKVVYKLDPTWFSNPKESRINRADQFRYGLRVWGVTQITACVYIKDSDKPVVRSGSMSLKQTQYLEPGSPELCVE